MPRATERRAPSNPECYSSYSFQPVHRALPSEESKHKLKAGEVKETIGGTRRSREPTMPSFSDLRRRLPSPLHSTVTVYIHLTETRIEKTDRYRTTLRRRENHSRSRYQNIFCSHLSRTFRCFSDLFSGGRRVRSPDLRRSSRLYVPSLQLFSPLLSLLLCS